tara:strand:- start:5470 stop:6237 length:768 start_codon:yes stop_codon:yes gene_type:complete
MLRILERDGDSLRFECRGFDISIVNALRRTILSEVPVLAISRIDVEENSGLTRAEELELRIGLCPLATVDSAATGAVGTVGTFELDVECIGDDVVEVLSGALQWKGDGSSPMLYEDVLITKLSRGQFLRLRAFAVLGIGKNNARFSPVSTCTYRFVPRVRLRRAVSGDEARDLANRLPKVFAVSTEGFAEVLDERSYYFDIDVPPSLRDAVDVSYDDDHVIFTIETTGTVDAVEVVRRAFRVLDRRLDEFAAGAK